MCSIPAPALALFATVIAAGAAISCGGEGDVGSEGDVGGEGERDVGGGEGDVGGEGEGDAGGELIPGDVVMTRVGRPLWDVADCNIVQQNVGTASDVQPAIDSFTAFWEKHAFDAARSAIAPDVAHAGPYDHEVSDDVARLGLSSSRSRHEADWIAPAGLVLYCVAIPSDGAPSGKTPDFDEGPMIPETALPIQVDGDVLADGVVVDPFFDSTYPTVDELAAAAAADGFSHMPFSFGENAAYVPGGRGSYAFRVQLTDANGDGWIVTVPFVINARTGAVGCD